MALSWGFLVAIFAILAGFAESQTSTTVAPPAGTTSTVAIPHSAITATPAAATVAATTSTPEGGSVTATSQIAATATMSVAPTSSITSPGLGFNLYLNISFKSTSGCDAAKDKLINSTFASFFSNKKFDLKKPIVCDVKREECLYNCSITFGPKLMMYNNISEVFKDKLKIFNGTLKLSKIQEYVPGIVLGEWDAETEECKKCCGEGAGGPITVRRTCEPQTANCRKFEKKVSACLDFCSKKCSGVMCKISLLVLLFGAFMNWFLK